MRSAQSGNHPPPRQARVSRIATDIVVVMWVLAAIGLVIAPFRDLAFARVGAGSNFVYREAVDGWGRITSTMGGSSLDYHGPRYAIPLYGLAALLLVAAVGTAFSRVARWPLIVGRQATVGTLVVIALAAADVAASLRMANLVAVENDLFSKYEVRYGGFALVAIAAWLLIALLPAWRVGRGRDAVNRASLDYPMSYAPAEARLVLALPWFFAGCLGIGGCFLTLWRWSQGSNFQGITGLGTFRTEGRGDVLDGAFAVPFIAAYAPAALLLFLGAGAIVSRSRRWRWISTGLYGSIMAGSAAIVVLLSGRAFVSFGELPFVEAEYSLALGFWLLVLSGVCALLGALVAIVIPHVEPDPTAAASVPGGWSPPHP